MLTKEAPEENKIEDLTITCEGKLPGVSFKM